MDGTSEKRPTRWRRGNPFRGVLWTAGLVLLICVVFFILPYYAMHNDSMRARILNRTLHRYLLAPDWELRIDSVERFGMDGARMRGVRLVHRYKGGEETYARAGIVDVDFDLVPLFQTQFIASRLVLDSVSVRTDLPPPEFRMKRKHGDGGSGRGAIRLPVIRIGLLSVSGIEIENEKGVIARGGISLSQASHENGKVHVAIGRIDASTGRDSLGATIQGGTIEGSLSDSLRLTGTRLDADGLLSRIDAGVHMSQGANDPYRARVAWNLDRITPGRSRVLRRLKLPFAAEDSLRGFARAEIGPTSAAGALVLHGRILGAPLELLQAIASRSGDRIDITDLSITHRAGRITGDGEIGLDRLNVRANIRLQRVDLGDPSLAQWIPKGTNVRIDGRISGSTTLGRPNPEAEGVAAIDSIGFMGHAFGPFQCAGRYRNDEVVLDSLDLGRPRADGRVDGRVTGRWSLRDGTLDGEARFTGFSLPKWIGPFVHGIPFEGRADGSLILSGTARSPRVSGRLEGRDFRVVEVYIARSVVDSIHGTLSPFDLHADGHAGGIRIYGVRADTGDVHMDWDQTMRVRATAQSDSIHATTHVTITPKTPGFLTIDELHLFPGNLPPWTLAAPGRIDWNRQLATVQPFRLESSDGVFDGDLRAGQGGRSLDGRGSLRHGNLEMLRRLTGLPDSTLAGSVDIQGTIGGTALMPSGDASVEGHDLVVARWPVGDLHGRFALESSGTVRIDSLRAGSKAGQGRLRAAGLAAHIPVPMPTFTRTMKDSLTSYLRRMRLEGTMEVDSLSLNRIIKTSLGGTASAEAGLLAEAIDPMVSRIRTIRPGQEERAVSIQQGVGGEIRGRVVIGGTGAAPLARASGEVRNLRVYEARADSLDFAASLEPGRAVLDSLVWHRRGRASRAHGMLPLAVSLEPGKTRLDRNAPLSFDAELPEIDLAILGVLSPLFLEPAGTLSGSLSLRGSMAKPRQSGSLAIRDGAFRIPNREERLHHINGDLVVDSAGIHVSKLTAREGSEGTIEVTGVFRDMNHFQMDAKVRDATVFETGLYHFTADGDFSAYPVVSTLGSYPLVVGSVDVRRGAIIGDLAKVPPPPPGSTRARSPWHAEIDVHAPGNLRLQTAIASIDLGEGDLHVSFIDPEFNVSGGVTVLGGRYRVFNNVFNVTGGTVQFRDLGRQPEPILDITAQTEVDEPGEPPTKVTITINVTGPLTKLDLAFSSSPSRSEDEIIALLSLGRFQNQQTGSIGVGTVGSPGGQYILTELVSQMESQITQLVSPLQNVSIQPGVAPNEPWKLNVRQNVLLPQISLGYSRDLVFAQSATQNVSLRYNLGGVFYLNADVQRGLSGVTQVTPTDRYSLDLKLRFEYK